MAEDAAPLEMPKDGGEGKTIIITRFATRRAARFFKMIFEEPIHL